MARGLIDVVSELQSRNSGSVGRVSLPPDTGLEQAFAGVAKDFKAIGDEIGQMADKAAAKEGELEGKFAGLDPEFRTRRDGTIRGEAFDRAGLDIAETRIRQDLAAGIDAASAKHAGDPQKLAAAIDGVGAGVLKNVPDELKPKLLLKIRGQRLSAMREAARQQAARLQQEAHAAAADDVALTLKGLEQKGALAGLDPTADDLLAGEMASIADTMARKGPNGKPLYTPDQIRTTMAKADDIVVRSRIWGTFDRLPSVEAKAEFIRNFEADWREGKGVAKRFDFDKMQSVSRFLEGEMRRDKTEASAASRALGHELKLLQQRYEAGYEVRPDEAAQLAARIGAAGTAEQKGAFLEAEDALKAQQWFRKLTPAEMDAEIERRRADLMAGDPALKSRAMRHLQLFEAVQRSAQGEIKRDPIGWAERTQLFKSPVVQLDFSSDEKLAATLKARVAQADALTEYYGRDAMQREGRTQYLRPGDVSALGGVMAKGGAGALRLAGVIAQAAPEQAEAIMAQLGKHAPAMAHLGRLVAADPSRPPQVAIDAANGFALKRVEGFKPLLDQAAAQRLAVSELAQAFRAMGGESAAVMEAARAAYEVRARQRGHDSFNPDLWLETVREAAGQRTIDGVSYGGIGKTGTYFFQRPVVVPAEIKTSEFDRVVATLSDADFKVLGQPVDDKRRPFSMAQVRQSSLVYVGPGRYAVVRDDSDPGAPKVMMGPDGGPWVLDLSKIMSDLKKRRPEAFR